MIGDLSQWAWALMVYNLCVRGVLRFRQGRKSGLMDKKYPTVWNLQRSNQYVTNSVFNFYHENLKQ